MASSITASVGSAGGVNRRPDVLTVQRLLNQVPPVSGGPTPPLVTDGVCGMKTKAAIQKFQIQQFGWSGADGRVDPGGRTHQRLNDFDVPFLTNGSVLLCPHGGMVQAVLVPLGSSRPGVSPGLFALSALDAFVISGCPFVTTFPSPCIGAQWFNATQTGFLTVQSIGLSVSAAQVPQGPVLVAQP